MVARIATHPGRIILDVASGTGDIPLRLLNSGGAKDRVLWATDLSPQMLAIARQKLAAHASSIQIAIRNAENLTEVGDESVDLYSISFGMKICDRTRVIAEAHRVLKRGGTLFCLEASRIPVAFVHTAYLRYMDWCLPLIGRVAANGDASAYDYLLRGVHDFPDQRGLARELENAGFQNVRYENLTLGIVALHEAQKPG